MRGDFFAEDFGGVSLDRGNALYGSVIQGRVSGEKFANAAEFFFVEENVEVVNDRRDVNGIFRTTEGNNKKGEEEGEKELVMRLDRLWKRILQSGE